MTKYSKQAQKTIGNKLEKMAGEDRPQDQKIAIAISEAREKGFKVPDKLIKRKKKKDKHD